MSVIDEWKEALTFIAEGRGTFSTDHLTHASNCIDEAKEKASAILADLEQYEVVEGYVKAPYRNESTGEYRRDFSNQRKSKMNRPALLLVKETP